MTFIERVEYQIGKTPGLANDKITKPKESDNTWKVETETKQEKALGGTLPENSFEKDKSDGKGARGAPVYLSGRRAPLGHLNTFTISINPDRCIPA